MNELLDTIKLCYYSSFILFILCIIFDKGPLTVKTLILAIFILAIPIINIFVYLFTFLNILKEYKIVKESRGYILDFIKKIDDLITKILNYRIK